MLWVFGLAVLLRIALLWRPDPLGYDETFSVLVARLPWARLLVATAGDVHPPLYYGLLKLWLIVWGWLPVEIAARALSLVLSVGSFGLWYLILWGMDDVPAELKRAAFIITCFMPGLIYFSIEARMYALLAFLLLLAWYCLLDERPMWAGVALGLAALTHNAGLLYAVALAGVYIASRREWQAVWMLFITAGIAWLIYLPWAAVILDQVAATRAGYWTWGPTFGTLAYMWFQAVAYSSHLPVGVDAALMLLVAGCTTFGLWQARRQSATWLPIAFSLLAVVVSYALGVGVLLHRALTPAVYPLTIAWATVLRRQDVGRVLSALAALGAAVVIGIYAIDGRNIGQMDVMSALPQKTDVLIATSLAAAPLALHSPMPVVVADDAPVPGLYAGLSQQTATALGITIYDPEAIPWTRAALIHITTPDGAANDAYAAHLVELYHGQPIDYNFAPLEGELWLLQR